jgi:hypothetical protein
MPFFQVQLSPLLPYQHIELKYPLTPNCKECIIVHRRYSIYYGQNMKSRENEIRNMVKERYGNIAQYGNSCCSRECCSDEANPVQILKMGQKIGYTKEQLRVGSGGANLGLGCGHPIGLADLKPGETVIDLGPESCMKINEKLK